MSVAVLSWEEHLKLVLPLYGHRNWIVVADSAYPAHSNAGIETIVVNESQVDVLRKVLAALAAVTHVKPKAYMDAELAFVPDSAASGVNEYRTQLMDMLKDTDKEQLPHEEIIGKLDNAAQVFRALIIKTTMTTPYTSVFLELDCAYWNAASERNLRAAMASTKITNG